MASAGSRRVLNFQLQDDNGIVSSRSKDCHVVDIQIGVAGAGVGGGATTTTNCCAVCTEPLEWVAVGQCGHAVVCSKCMIRMRHVNGDKRCCVCRANCPNVLVTKAAGGGGDATPVVHAFREYWYHKKTTAYFDDEVQYQAARDACRKKLSPFYHPLVLFIPVFGLSIGIGAIIGSAGARETKHMALKVLAFALCISFWVAIVSLVWFAYKCNRDPFEDDDEEGFRVVARPTTRSLPPPARRMDDMKTIPVPPKM